MPRQQHIGYVALLVHEYEEAIAYFSTKLGFTLVYDRDLGDGKRWILMAPPGSRETKVLLAKAIEPREVARVGDQTGGRVCFFLHTDDFRRDYDTYRSRGVVFVENPREESYGTVAVFTDLYGNRWDLLQLKENSV